MPEFPELPAVHEITGAEDEHREQRFARVVALAIVLTTLAAAVSAYLQSAATRRNDAATVRATQLTTDAVAARSRIGHASEMLVARYDLAEAQRARAGLAQQRALFGPPASRAALAAETRRWRMVAARSDLDTRTIAKAYDLAPVGLRSPNGPQRDRSFP